VLTQTWNAPESLVGWEAFAGMTLTSTLSVLLIFVSVTRIGPFRTALIMNLEPLDRVPRQLAHACVDRWLNVHCLVPLK